MISNTFIYYTNTLSLGEAMKKCIQIVVFIALSMYCASHCEAVNYIVKTHDTKVRRAPNSHEGHYGTLTKNVEVAILDSRDGWYLISEGTHKLKGWVKKEEIMVFDKKIQDTNPTGQTTGLFYSTRHNRWIIVPVKVYTDSYNNVYVSAGRKNIIRAAASMTDTGKNQMISLLEKALRLSDKARADKSNFADELGTLQTEGGLLELSFTSTEIGAQTDVHMTVHDFETVGKTVMVRINNQEVRDIIKMLSAL